jgi:2-polyprenyl-3-methyl-5-hydroxy-6-metoxy-1,4-benzoquinol methylase
MRSGAIPENLVEFILSPFGVLPTPLVDTFQAIVRARAIMVATKLGIFEALQDGPKSAIETAQHTETDRRAMEKLLNCLVGAGYLRFASSRYRLSPTARRWMLKSSRVSLHDNMLHRFLEWDAVESFEDFVRTGKPLNVHENLSKEQWEAYQCGMRSLAGLAAPEVARRLPVPLTAKAMLDVGGSHGYYSVAICRRHPQLQSMILDLPSAIEFAKPILERERMGDRISHRACDVLTADLGTNQWDLVFSSQLVHHFDEPTNVQLMERIAQTLRPGGVAAIVEILRPSSPNEAGETGAVLDLFFATTSLSGCWSWQEIAGWQRRAGLVPQKPIRLRFMPGAAIQVATKPL